MRAVVIINPLVLGIVTMWLYAVLRSRYGPGPKTAAIAALAVWLFRSWIDVTWAMFTGVPYGDPLAPLGATLPILLVATFAGAWLYKESPHTESATA
jgi:hypothetical protein